jgi:hypothetical protein
MRRTPIMADPDFTPPPIPVHLAGSRTQGGLVVAYVTLRHRNGDAALGLIDHQKVTLCLHGRRCGVCGLPMDERMVFLMRQIDLDRKRSSEPGMCPPCAAYTQRACPMISGAMKHGRKSLPQFVWRECGDPLCLCWSWIPPGEPGRYGAPADRWFAVWLASYMFVHDEAGSPAADFSRTRVLAVRPITPGEQPGGDDPH